MQNTTAKKGNIAESRGMESGMVEGRRVGREGRRRIHNAGHYDFNFRLQSNASFFTICNITWIKAIDRSLTTH